MRFESTEAAKELAKRLRDYAAALEEMPSAPFDTQMSADLREAADLLKSHKKAPPA